MCISMRGPYPPRSHNYILLCLAKIIRTTKEDIASDKIDEKNLAASRIMDIGLTSSLCRVYYYIPNSKWRLENG